MKTSSPIDVAAKPEDADVVAASHSHGVMVSAVDGLLITRAEWHAMVQEDPQADPFWLESWLGRIDPVAGRRPELGAAARADVQDDDESGMHGKLIGR